jgi:hypothetical protein
VLEDPFLETADRNSSAKSAGDDMKFIQALHMGALFNTDIMIDALEYAPVLTRKQQ